MNTHTAKAIELIHSACNHDLTHEHVGQDAVDLVFLGFLLSKGLSNLTHTLVSNTRVVIVLDLESTLIQSDTCASLDQKLVALNSKW